MGLPLPSGENFFSGYFILGTFALGIVLVISDIVVRIKSRSASFKAEILNRKSSYHEGDTVQFWAQYAGKLDKGYFLAEINAPSGTTLPNGKQKIQAIDPTTYHSPLVGHGRMGRVSGTNTPPREWGFQIPSKYPVGKYRVVFEVWDGEFGKAKRLAWAEDFFVVESGPIAQTELKRREWNAHDVVPPLPIESVPPFLKIPLRDWLGKKLPDFCNVQVKSMSEDHVEGWSEVSGIVQDSNLVPYRFTFCLDSKGKIDRKKSYIE